MRPKVSKAEIAKRMNKYKYVLLILCLGVVLMLLPTGDKTENDQTAPARADYSFDVDALEKKLSRSLSEISGVGEATVVLTLRSSGEEILAQDISQGTSYDTETVIISTSGNTEQPISIKTIYPEFQGALVICEGAGSATVKLQILQAVSAITGLSSDRISICQRK